ncbi:MAG: ABC transporter ATP-binding protein [Coriobacteriia bacterium]|nr:ABC transporter ATP-binding protein [Coriobacteriia bacterium]
MNPTEHTAVLSVRGLDYDYNGAKALSDVTFDARAGEILALIGRNGAGKSTLLRCLAGWSAPGRGEIDFLGTSLKTLERSARREIVLVTDTPPFYDDLTAREHLQFVLRANRLEDRLGTAESLLSSFGIRNSADAYPSTFSRGMRYKLALVLALSLRPKLLLLDEPFGPLDPVSSAGLWRELQTAAENGSAIVLSSHQMPEGAVPDRYVVLEEGILLAEGTGDEIAQAGATLEDVLRVTLEGGALA